MALVDELMKLRRELASAGSPLQRMQMLARSWRSVRQLSPAERKQLAKAVGAEGAEGVLDRIAALKGRVGASFLVPALEKFKGLDPDALSRLIEALQDPEQRREVLRKSVGAVGDVLTEEPAPDPEADFEVDSEPEPAVEAEPETEIVVDDESDLEVVADSPGVDEDATPVPPPPRSPVIEPEPPPPVATAPTPDPPVEPPGFEEVRDAASLGRRLALARAVLDEDHLWNVNRLRSLLDLFPQDWARRRILSAMLASGLPADTAEAIDLIDSLESRASRRWCLSVLSHDRQLSEAERQAVSEAL